MRVACGSSGRRGRLLLRMLAASALATWVALVGASSAESQCLTGPSATGFESGTQTLSVLIPNEPAETQLVGVSCENGFGLVGPLTKLNGAGEARFVATPLGYRAYTGLLVGGEGTGSGASSVGGSARYVVRATPTPSYTGPAVVNVDVTLQADVRGDVSVSGAGSAGGSYSTEVSLRPLDSQIGVVLFTGGNALASDGTYLLTNSAAIDVDRDYVLQIAHSQSVSASYAPGPMGQASSATSDGGVALSFETQLSVADSELSIQYPMVAILGGPPPSLGNPPGFPVPHVPVGSWAPVFVTLALGLAGALCAGAYGPRLRRGLPSA